jgi:dCTP deaminase
LKYKEKIFDSKQPKGILMARTNGILPSQTLRALIRDGEIAGEPRVLDNQVQPASLDLRLGAKAFRIRASFLPGRGRTVQEKLTGVAMHEIDLTEGAVLETGCVYLVPLMESLQLSERISGVANPKSSTGRLDVFTRLISDGATSFDRVEAGYNGPLYIEISPRTFSILVRSGTRLNQLRLRRGTPTFSDSELMRLQDQERIVVGDVDIDGGIACSVDLIDVGDNGLVGYRAKRHAGLIDVDKPGLLKAQDFWEPVIVHGSGQLILDPDEFYILVSKEAIHIPPDYAAEMEPFNPLVGEFRVHYAGFFDPGFGHSASGGSGARAVLEVRSHDVPFILEDGQIVGRFVFEHMLERPDEIYGQDIGSNYQAQGLKLSKHFVM